MGKPGAVQSGYGRTTMADGRADDLVAGRPWFGGVPGELCQYHRGSRQRPRVDLRPGYLGFAELATAGLLSLDGAVAREWRSASRARATRERTVPTGQPQIWAVSW